MEHSMRASVLSCVQLCNPMSYRPQGSSVYRILQARLLALIVISYSRKDSTEPPGKPKCSTWVQSQKWQNNLCSFPRQTIQYHSNTNLCPNHCCQRSWSWTVLWRPSRTNTRKRCPFHHRELKCKIRKSINNWSNRHFWSWSTKWGRAKANQVLPREHTGQSKCPLPKTQEITLHMDITTWLILKSNWLYSLQLKMEKLYTVSKNRTKQTWSWL